MSKRSIIVHLPSDMTDTEHAKLANAVWAMAFGADSVEVEAPKPDLVGAEMDRLWKAVPEWTGSGWRRRRS